MKKLIVYLLVLTTVVLTAQKKQVPLYIEHNSFFEDNIQTEYFTYRVPYNHLLFIKVNDNYKTSFTLSVEIYNDDDEFVQRKIIQPSFSISKYDETISNEKYYQGTFKVNLPAGKYKLKSLFSLESTDLEYKVPDQDILIKPLEDLAVFPPIIVNEETVDNNNFILSNYASKIPFGAEKHSLLIRFPNTEINEIRAKILQTKEVVLDQKIKSVGEKNIKLENTNGDIILSADENGNSQIFIVSGFSHLLREGKCELVVEYDTSEVKFPINTLWFNKPRVLNNPEYSIKLLGYIEKDNTIGKLLSFDDEDYYKELSNYWVQNYPADGMQFNYAMEEFYTRADHAIKTYSSLNSYDGAERDRGKIYILYGEPTSIERNYTEINEIVEVWKYEKAGRKFIFKDTKGTGKFDLIK